MGIRRWVAIMASLSTLQEQAPVYISQPLSPLGSPAGEGDWQTLTQVRPGPLSAVPLCQPPSSHSCVLVHMRIMSMRRVHRMQHVALVTGKDTGRVHGVVRLAAV